MRLALFLAIVVVVASAFKGGGKSSPGPSPTPTPVASPTATPSSTPTPRPSASPAPTLPPLPSTVVRVRKFPGADLGAQINAASKSVEGPALLITPPGTIATQVRLRKSHVLKLEKGRYVVTFGGLHSPGAIILDDNCGIVGAGIGESVIVEPPTGYIVVESVGSGQTLNGFYDAGVTSNLLLRGFTIEGANTRPEGGVRGSIKLGNAHHVRVSNVELRNTSCLGITAGGTALAGNHAEDWIVEHCIFRGVASQALNVVNGRQVIFRYNKFLDSGKFPSMGMTPIDVEPNTPSDWAREITIVNNLVDSSNSTFAHGNGILVQNGAQTAGFGPVLVKDNIVIGGPLVQGFNSRIYTGIYINGERVTVTNNSVQRTAHSGIRLEGCQNVTVGENSIVSTGTGGIKALEVINTVDSVIRGNQVLISPLSPLGSDWIVESGSSDRNRFSGNRAAEVIVVGAHTTVTTERLKRGRQ